MPFIKTAVDIFTSLAGVGLIGSGLRGVFAPAAMARTFGLVNVTPESVIFYPGLAGRNVAMGVALWWYKIQGMRRAMGVLTLCAALNGVSDVFVLLTHDGEVDNVPIHVFNLSALIAMGTLLLNGY